MLGVVRSNVVDDEGLALVVELGDDLIAWFEGAGGFILVLGGMAAGGAGGVLGDGEHIQQWWGQVFTLVGPIFGRSRLYAFAWGQNKLIVGKKNVSFKFFLLVWACKGVWRLLICVTGAGKAPRW